MTAELAVQPKRKREGDGLTALLTGASGGIGWELARCFAQDGYNLVLAARSGGQLQTLARELAEEYMISAVPITCDLSQPGAGTRLVEELDARGIAVDVLVNNAGYGLRGAFAESNLAGQLGMVDLNVRTLVELTNLLWPRILKCGRGGLLNVASTAAFQPGPMMATYSATKAFVLSLTEALWEEARPTKLRVSCLCPGATATQFAGRAGMDQARLYHARVMSAQQVARLGYRAFKEGRRIEITGLGNALMVLAGRFSPRRIVLKIARRQMNTHRMP
ncbi:MAG TPA: SDR family oxidoreductase [Steroidobacteraceae bacterium]|nr:SDR family oxidoreductase [Steroidobacteraceae bacterium]